MARKGDVSFYTYDDPGRRFTEAIAVREPDARAYAVQATGGVSTEAPLTVTELKRLVLDGKLPDTFTDGEWCDRPDPSCPTLGVPVPGERD
jgi:hypothetical protein